MFNKIIITSLLFFIANSAFSQHDINNYKYIIVPASYSFLNEPDQYQLNSISHFLFNKYGFHSIMEGEEYPEELQNDVCLALHSDLLKATGVFKTKLTIELKNCKGELVYVSNVGESREKKFKVAYNKALRAAFTSFETVNYKYNGTIHSVSQKDGVIQDSDAQKEMSELKEKIRILEEEKATKEVIVPTVAIKKIESPKVVQKQETKVAKVIVPAVAIEKTVESKETFKQELTKKEIVIETLYAHPIANGFQLVDSSPKVVMVLYKTGISDFYIVNGKDAIVYKKIGDIWLYLEANAEGHDERPIHIKF